MPSLVAEAGSVISAAGLISSNGIMETAAPVSIRQRLETPLRQCQDADSVLRKSRTVWLAKMDLPERQGSGDKASTEVFRFKVY